MDAYKQAYRSLNQTQKLAVDNIDGPLLIVAGPGTGKTQLLTTRIAHILANTDTLAENILCLTFTESAAQTMRERLIQLIGQPAYAVTISTYHSFGSEIIRRYPEYFSDFSSRQPVDELGADSIIRNIIAELEYDNPLKFAESYVKDIIGFISDAKTALLTPEAIYKIVKQNLEFIKLASRQTIDVLSGMTRVDKHTQALFKELLAKLQNIKIAVPSIPGIVSLQQLAIEDLQNALTEADELKRTIPLTNWKNKWLSKNVKAEFILDGQLAQLRLKAAADIYQKYQIHLDRDQLFDYDDMILQAVNLLDKNKDLRFSLQEQYLYILLDEFQDTNNAQLRLVELITDSPLYEGRPNICAVGDDDQAIYAFQGAHYSHMLKFKTLYRDVSVISLEDNYRSTKEIIDFSQNIVKQINERLQEQLDIKKVIRASHKPPLSGLISREEAISDVEQYTWIAQKIAELVKTGHKLSEIAVMAPQHRYLEALIGFLHKENLPVYYERRENILDDPLIIQLIHFAELIQALVDKNQDIVNELCPEVLSYDFWGIETSKIWQLAWQSRDTNKSWLENMINDAQLRPICLFILRLGTLAKVERLEVIMDYLIGTQPCPIQEAGETLFTSPFYEYYFGDQARAKKLGQYWQLLTNLTVLKANLNEYQRNDLDPLNLNDLLVFVQRHRLANIKIINSSPYHEAEDAVRLMTTYKAKGSEFQTVFIIDCNDEVWGGKSRNAVSRLALPKNLTFIRYSDINDDERLRLFYVAITRAKQNLYITNYRQNFIGKVMTRLKYLDESDNGKGIVVSPYLPEGRRRVESADIIKAISTEELSTYWYRRHESAIQQPKLATLLHERVAKYQLSPTNLSNFTDVVHAGPSYFLLYNLLSFPRAASISSLYGSAIHDTLLWIHNFDHQNNKLPSESALLQHFENNLISRRLSKQETARLLRRGKKTLAIYLEQRAATIKPTNICEYNFKNEAVFLGDAHLTGKIDKLIIDEPSKSIAIVDYKTGHHYTRWQRSVSLHRYQQQLYFYKLLVEKSRRFQGYKITDAYLEFVEPDDEGVIHELHIVYDETQQERLELLAKAVWQKITTLQLPEISDYTLDISGIEKFEAELLAG